MNEGLLLSQASPAEDETALMDAKVGGYARQETGISGDGRSLRSSPAIEAIALPSSGPPVPHKPSTA